MKRKDYRGFTLVESLLVLLVVTGLLLLPALGTRSWYEKQAIEQFLTQYHKLYYEVQHSAVVGGSKTQWRIEDYPDEDRITFDTLNREGRAELVELFLPDGLKMSHQYKGTFVFLRGSGRVGGALGDRKFIDKKHKRKIIFGQQMGGHLVRTEEKLP